jgi:ArsR family transcriptional regulator
MIVNRQYLKVFRAVGDPNRLRILKMLGRRELCLCEVREMVQLSNSTVSRHLSVLREAGLILDSRRGKWVYFRLNRQSIEPVVQSILALVGNTFNNDDQIRADAKKLRRVHRTDICTM